MIRKLPVFILLLFVLPASSQESDSAYAEREARLLEAVKYRYNIFKFDVCKTFVGGVDLIYERRANLNISYIGDLYWNFGESYKGFYATAGLRYYYNLEKRILERYEKKGEQTSCMSGNYFQADLCFFNKAGEIHKDDGVDGPGIAPGIRIGVQRKLGRIFYWDYWFGYQLPFPDRRPVDDRILNTGTLRIGFAFGIGYK